MKIIIIACLVAFAAAGGIVPSAPIAAYSSPFAYSGYSPISYSSFYNNPLAYNNAPFVRSSFGYSPALAPLAYSNSPFYRNSFFRGYPYAY